MGGTHDTAGSKAGPLARGIQTKHKLLFCTTAQPKSTMQRQSMQALAMDSGSDSSEMLGKKHGVTTTFRTGESPAEVREAPCEKQRSRSVALFRSRQHGPSFLFSVASHGRHVSVVLRAWQNACDTMVSGTCGRQRSTLALLCWADVEQYDVSGLKSKFCCAVCWLPTTRCEQTFMCCRRLHVPRFATGREARVP